MEENKQESNSEFEDKDDLDSNLVDSPFAPGQHQLEDVVRKMKRNAQEAVNFLVRQMRDAKNDMPTRISLAKHLMKYNTEVINQLNSDCLNRAILEFKNTKSFKVSAEAEPPANNAEKESLRNISRVDFSTIKKID